MISRFAAMLMVWVGLFGAAYPVMACAERMSRDCCPPGTESPCPDEIPGAPGMDAASCCVAAPPTVPSARADATPPRTTLSDADAPDPLFLTAWFISAGVGQAARAGPLPDVLSYRDDASLTYLRTARLRL